jgi:transglutaminase-like putative cysteine protease
MPSARRTHRDQLRRAVVTGELAPATVTDADRIVYRRPRRYAESDRLATMAQTGFAGITDPPSFSRQCRSWIGSRLSYLPGSRLPTEGAVDTMLSRRGVCWDYAHLAIEPRVSDVPPRLVAGYAPELHPMDFHAVARATIARRLCTIARFYRYAVEEDLLDHSPAAHVRRPRLDYESHVTALDRNELGALLVAARVRRRSTH